MKEVIAVRHVGFEHLGTLAPFLSGRGFRIRYLDAGVNDISSVAPLAPDLLVILGGPIGAIEESEYPYLNDELRLIEKRLLADKPLLGICLGAQLMARALGSRVFPGRAKEIGWAPIRLSEDGIKSCLSGLEACDHRVLHWHGDTFDLPKEAKHLASSDITENQAFSYGEKALALQFHLEADPAEIERWLIGHAHEISATGGISPELLRLDTQQHGPRIAIAARTCMQQWLEQTGLLPVPAKDNA